MFRFIVHALSALSRVLARVRAEFAEAQQHIVPAFVAGLAIGARLAPWT